MPYTKDKWIVSMIWGRLGAAILTLTAAGVGVLGYTIGPDEIQTAETLITSILAGVGGMLALVSKVREAKKVDES